jgi:hypothetical protein
VLGPLPEHDVAAEHAGDKAVVGACGGGGLAGFVQARVGVSPSVTCLPCLVWCHNSSTADTLPYILLQTWLSFGRVFSSRGR